MLLRTFIRSIAKTILTIFSSNDSNNTKCLFTLTACMYIPRYRSAQKTTLSHSCFCICVRTRVWCARVYAVCIKRSSVSVFIPLPTVVSLVRIVFTHFSLSSSRLLRTITTKRAHKNAQRCVKSSAIQF